MSTGTLALSLLDATLVYISRLAPRRPSRGKGQLCGEDKTGDNRTAWSAGVHCQCRRQDESFLVVGIERK